MSKVAIYDEQIKTEKDNIDANKRALQQMDAQVDSLLGRTDTERGAERAVLVRKQQAKERSRGIMTDLLEQQPLQMQPLRIHRQLLLVILLSQEFKQCTEQRPLALL